MVRRWGSSRIHGFGRSQGSSQRCQGLASGSIAGHSGSATGFGIGIGVEVWFGVVVWCHGLCRRRLSVWVWRLGLVLVSALRYGLASWLGVRVCKLLETDLGSLGMIISHYKVETTSFYYSSNNMVTNNYGLV